MESKEKFKPNHKLRLLDRVIQVLRDRHYAHDIKQAHCNRILQVRPVLWQQNPSKDVRMTEVKAFLNLFATRSTVSAAPGAKP
jgi:hypothetical protein